jgi:outer membrane protein assembly factor BamD
MIIRIFIIIPLITFLISCSKEDVVYEASKKVDPIIIYKEGLKAFDDNDFFFASKKFDEAELNFKQPVFAAKAAIMSSFALYGINFYDEAEENLKRFLITYPGDKNVVYAHYLSAIISYEQIEDEKKDLEPLLQAQNKINYFLEKFPNNDYARDLKFKKNLIQNQLAAKELYIAKYYISVQKWVPAIKRLKIIVNDYDKTIFIEEALHRLVEINYYLGLNEESKKYASILGYNYNSSEWYQQSYKILNKDYKIIKKKKKKKKDSLFKKIIKMID